MFDPFVEMTTSRSLDLSPPRRLLLKPLTSILGVHSERHVEDGIQLFKGLLFGLRQEK